MTKVFGSAATSDRCVDDRKQDEGYRELSVTFASCDGGLAAVFIEVPAS